MLTWILEKIDGILKCQFLLYPCSLIEVLDWDLTTSMIICDESRLPIHKAFLMLSFSHISPPKSSHVKNTYIEIEMYLSVQFPSRPIARSAYESVHLSVCFQEARCGSLFPEALILGLYFHT